MFSLYLLLALTTSHSIYAADTDTDTEKSALLSTSNTTQGMPETVPLPDGLIAIADSNKDVVKLDGCFFPEKGVAFISVLRLCSLSEDPKENEHKLTTVQDLLKESVSKGLQERRSPFSPFDGNVLSHACTHVNDTLWKALSTAGEKLIEHRTQYKVVGFLLLLTKRSRTAQNLKGSPKGILPCEPKKEPINNTRFLINTHPKLTEKEVDELIIGPLTRGVDNIDNIAKITLPYLKSKQADNLYQHVHIIDTGVLEGEENGCILS